MKNVFKALGICTMLCGGVVSAFGVRSALQEDFVEGMDDVDKSSLRHSFDKSINKNISSMIDSQIGTRLGKVIFDAVKDYMNSIVEKADVDEAIEDKNVGVYVLDSLKDKTQGILIKNIEIEGINVFKECVDKDKYLAYVVDDMAEAYRGNKGISEYFKRKGIENERSFIGVIKSIFDASRFCWDFTGENGKNATNSILQGEYPVTKAAYAKLAKEYNESRFTKEEKEQREKEIEDLLQKAEKLKNKPFIEDEIKMLKEAVGAGYEDSIQTHKDFLKGLVDLYLAK